MDAPLKTLELARDATGATAKTHWMVFMEPTKDARPGRLWQAGSFDRDWPEDADHENGNYSNKCLGCGGYFVGHKRRCFCRKCSDASKPRWGSLTPEQRAAEQRKADTELTVWLSSQSMEG